MEEDPVWRLQKEASCPICLELFREPVSIACGHSFCGACLARCWEEKEGSESGGPFLCPQCRQEAPRSSLRPNRELGNVAHAARGLSSLLFRDSGGGKEPEEGQQLLFVSCPRHREALKLFCGQEEQLICLVCRESRAHRAHRPVLPLDEAAHEYKKDIQTRLQSLKEERETLMGLNLAGELKHQEYLRQIEAEKQKASSEFEQIRHFLEEQEKLLLAQLNELEKEIVKHQKEHSTTFSDEILSLTAVITEVEEKCELPDSEFLQDIKNTLSRFDKDPFQPPSEMPCKIEKRLSEFSEKNNALTEIIKNFKDTLPSELGTEWVNVSLDIDTANPQVIISEDRKSARWDVTRTDLPQNPKRFKSSCCVLGCEGFDSGRHYWEVNVEDGGIWAVGVARVSVRRKIELKLTPEEGIWALQGNFGQYQALSTPVTPLSLSSTPRRIRVSLDYEKGQVEFFNADTKDSIFIFPSASFSGERVYPFFKVLLAQLTLDG